MAAMDDSYLSSGWNSSFDDNDASTTLDTSLDTTAASDSMVGKHSRSEMEAAVTNPFQQMSKLHTSRSSPTRPFDKDVHKARGYFDDVESFTSAAMRLQHEEALSPLSLPTSLHLRPLATPLGHRHHRKRMSIDTAVPDDDDDIIRAADTILNESHTNQNVGLGDGALILSEDGRRPQQQDLSSPVLSVSP